jgi:hypothetical protein
LVQKKKNPKWIFCIFYFCIFYCTLIFK